MIGASHFIMRWGFVHPVVHLYGYTLILVFVVLELHATQALELEFCLKNMTE